MTRDEAELIGVGALGWLAADDEILPIFLSLSGGSLADLRDGAADPATLGAVLDFVLTEDRWVLASAAHCGVAPERLAVARALLPGGGAPHWT